MTLCERQPHRKKLAEARAKAKVHEYDPVVVRLGCSNATISAASNFFWPALVAPCTVPFCLKNMFLPKRSCLQYVRVLAGTCRPLHNLLSEKMHLPLNRVTLGRRCSPLFPWWSELPKEYSQSAMRIASGLHAAVQPQLTRQPSSLEDMRNRQQGLWMVLAILQDRWSAFCWKPSFW